MCVYGISACVRACVCAHVRKERDVMSQRFVANAKAYLNTCRIVHGVTLYACLPSLEVFVYVFVSACARVC